jgi:tRNA(fMet)-specific endonuclease VapC
VILLDTDVLSIIQIGRGPSYERLVQRLDSSAVRPVAVSIVSYEEQMRGWLAYAARAKKVGQYVQAMRRLRAMLNDFSTREVVDFDDAAAVEFQRLLKLKLRLGTMDLRVAAIALAHSAVLVTRNLADFRRVPDLHAEDWTRA